MLHNALSEAQGWSMNKNMACSKERTMERHCLTLCARMQPKFARSRAQRWPQPRCSKDTVLRVNAVNRACVRVSPDGHEELRAKAQSLCMGSE